MLDFDRELTDVLRAHGRRVTSQRLLVHRILRERREHLSAEQVHRAARRELPATSLPTIYATLELLHELGAVRRIARAGRGTLFDGRSDPHAHAVCRSCGCVTDVEALQLAPVLAAAGQVGFAGEDAEVIVTGLCAACRG
ncbi:MAG: Fur family transcriptional regulator [Solirubrobacteraceae bacterium]